MDHNECHTHNSTAKFEMVGLAKLKGWPLLLTSKGSLSTAYASSTLHSTHLPSVVQPDSAMSSHWQLIGWNPDHMTTIWVQSQLTSTLSYTKISSNKNYTILLREIILCLASIYKFPRWITNINLSSSTKQSESTWALFFLHRMYTGSSYFDTRGGTTLYNVCMYYSVTG